MWCFIYRWCRKLSCSLCVSNNHVYSKGFPTTFYSVKAGSIGCLEVLVNHDEVDLDIKNRIEGETPLHLAVQFANTEHDMGFAMVDLLLAGGADPK
jgi:ankyrin repeat protein